MIQKKRLKTASTTTGLSPHDRIQALKHHPEFQRLLAIWRDILRKEQAGIERTDAEEALLWAPRSPFNVEAEMEASRYRLLSLAEHERAIMSEEDLAWRDCDPQLDWENKVAVIHIPLRWTIAAIERVIGRVVRVYRTRLGLTNAKHDAGALLDGVVDCDPQLKSESLTLRIPLKLPVEAIDQIVGRVVRVYKKALGLASPQRIRGPEVDPWLVYRLRREGKPTFLSIARQLFNNVDPDATPANDENMKRQYDQIRRAYAFAQQALDRIGEKYA